MKKNKNKYNRTTKSFSYHPLTAAICACLGVTPVSANPTGGNVVAGQANISNPTSTETVIQQTSDKAIINWNQFNIKANEHTRFIQPSTNSITLNRVTGKDPSAIMGQLSANGKIVLVNPNGIVFGPNSRVDVAALIASIHDIKNEDFMAGKLNFTIPGKLGAQVINQGTISVQEGGLVALVAHSVTNSGMIQARLGKVVLAAANTFTLDLYGDDLILFEADSKITEQLEDVFGNPIAAALENSGTIDAYSGYVLLTTDVAKNVVDKAINMTGIIKAQSAEMQEGTIILNANDGKTVVSGVLDTSAANGGNGGFIETSGSEVDIDPNTQIDTSSVFGNTGTWLLDPTDYYIAASGGDITGAALSGFLGLNNVIVQTATTGSGNGDIYVNDSIGWSNSNKLTLTAYRNININQTISNSGGGSIELRSDNTATSTGTVTFGTNGQISGVSNVELFYNPSSYTTPTNYTSNVSGGILTSYMLVNDVNQLQAIQNNLNGTYALGKDIDASNTTGWNGGTGFHSIGYDFSNPFTGVLDGRLHSINNIFGTSWIDGSYGYGGGLFYNTRDSIIRNLSLIGGRIIGSGNLGALVSQSLGSDLISNVHVNLTLEFNNNASVGGLVGTIGSGGTIIDSSSIGILTYDTNNQMSGNTVGGLVGSNAGTVQRSFSSSNISGTWTLGGLVAVNSGLIKDSFATGNITGNQFVGGLTGTNRNSIINSYSTGQINETLAGSNTALLGDAGGLNGDHLNINSISNSYWDINSSGVSTSHGGIGLTATQMKQQSSFSGWDFTNTWRIDEGVSYPTLAWQESSQASSSITLVSDQLSASSDSSSISYTENNSGTLTFPSSTLSGTHQPEITVKISTGFVAAEDYLDYTATGGVTGSYDAATGILTLSGLATSADYQTVLNSIKYRNASDNPNNTDRVISIAAGKSTATRTVSVVPVNDAPVLNTSVYDGSDGGISTLKVNVDSNNGVLISTLFADSHFIFDVDDDFRGIAVTNLDPGAWEYTTDGGTWLSFPAVSDGNALLLKSDSETRIRYVPNANVAAGTISKAFAFFAWDGEIGTNGQVGVNVNTRGGNTPYSNDWGRGIVTLEKSVQSTPPEDPEKGNFDNNIGKDPIISDPVDPVDPVDPPLDNEPPVDNPVSPPSDDIADPVNPPANPPSDDVPDPDPLFSSLQNAYNTAGKALEFIDVVKNPMKQLDLILEGMGDVFNDAASLLKRNPYDLSANLKEHAEYQFDLLISSSGLERDLTKDIDRAMASSDAIKNDLGNALENMALTTDAIRFALNSRGIYKNISSLSNAPSKINEAIESLKLNYKTDITLLGHISRDLMDLGSLVGSITYSPTVAWSDTLEESIAKYDSIASKTELLNIVKVGKEMQQAGEDVSKVQAFLSDAISLIVTATYEGPLEHIMNDSVERTMFTQQLLFDSLKTSKPKISPDTIIYKKVEVDSLWSTLGFGSPKYELESVAASEVFDFTADGKILWDSMK
jgi:filamentous hemagglutinin family protein